MKNTKTEGEFSLTERQSERILTTLLELWADQMGVEIGEIKVKKADPEQGGGRIIWKTREE